MGRMPAGLWQSALAARSLQAPTGHLQVDGNQASYTNQEAAVQPWRERRSQLKRLTWNPW